MAPTETMAAFLSDIADLDNVRIATVDGRYYAMDRDKRWERIERAYRTIAEASSPRGDDPLAGRRAPTMPAPATNSSSRPRSAIMPG